MISLQNRKDAALESLLKWDKTVTIVGKSRCHGYADVGFDVDIGPYFKLQLKQLNRLYDVHILGVLSGRT
jgi:hypothetical protein